MTENITKEILTVSYGTFTDSSGDRWIRARISNNTETISNPTAIADKEGINAVTEHVQEETENLLNRLQLITV